jgi:hypothetical protein
VVAVVSIRLAQNAGDHRDPPPAMVHTDPDLGSFKCMGLWGNRPNVLQNPL